MNLTAEPLYCYCIRNRICSQLIHDKMQKALFAAPQHARILQSPLRTAVQCCLLRRSKTELFPQRTEGCVYAVQPPAGTASTAAVGRAPVPGAVVAGCTIRQSHSFFQTEQFHFAAPPTYYEVWSAQAAVFQPTRLPVP